MSWFKRNRTDTPSATVLVDSDELTAFDRLTQRAAVGLSRRRFLKLLPVGGAVGAGLALVGTAEAVTCNTDTGDACGSVIRICIACSGSLMKERLDYYTWHLCTDGSQQCRHSYYTYGPCIPNCAN